MENIAVGLDGSAPALVALRWAATEAARFNARLTVVIAKDGHAARFDHDVLTNRARQWAGAGGVGDIDVAIATTNDGPTSTGRNPRLPNEPPDASRAARDRARL